jgi:hypothetical protein
VEILRSPKSASSSGSDEWSRYLLDSIRRSPGVTEIIAIYRSLGLWSGVQGCTESRAHAIQRYSTWRKLPRAKHTAKTRITALDSGRNRDMWELDMVRFTTQQYSPSCLYGYSGWAVLDWDCLWRFPEESASQGASCIRDWISRPVALDRRASLAA